MFQSDLFPAGEQLSSVPLAYAVGARIAALLASGRHLTRADISGLFAAETGALDWGSAWTIDDYNNAVEIGALLCFMLRPRVLRISPTLATHPGLVSGDPRLLSRPTRRS